MNNMCPGCGAVYGVAAQHVGRRFSCKKCGVALVVQESGLQRDDELSRPEEPVAPVSLPAVEPEVSVEPAPPAAPTGPSPLADFVAFRRLLVPLIIQMLFWVFAVFLVVVGIALIIKGAMGPFDRAEKILGGLIVLVFGPLTVRIVCELMIVVFRMHDTLVEIQREMRKRPEEKPEPVKPVESSG